MLCVKINSVEFQPGGQTPEVSEASDSYADVMLTMRHKDCKNLCIKLEEAGVDFVDLSGVSNLTGIAPPASAWLPRGTVEIYRPTFVLYNIFADGLHRPRSGNV